MKIIAVQFEDTVDISAFPKGATISIVNGEETLEGIVSVNIDALDPPGIDGTYNITKVKETENTEE